MQHMLAKPPSPALVCLVAFVIAVAISDMASRRIPNVLTVTGACVGLGANWLLAGGSGALASVAGSFVGLFVFLPFYLARGFSAGDVKAMAAIGAFVGPEGALFAAAWILVAGSLGGLVLLIAIGGRTAFTALIHRWSARALVLFSTGSPVRIEPGATDAARHRFPYGLAIACGTIVSLAWS
jgi:prepilin peptidase CpaA